MEEFWEKWISSLEMGSNNSFVPSLDEDMLFLKDFEPSFSFENACNYNHSSTTMQCNNNNNANFTINIADGTSPNTMDSISSLLFDEEEASLDDHEGNNNNNMLKRNNSSNSIIPQEHVNVAALHKPSASQNTFNLSFENSTVEPCATATHSSSVLCEEKNLNNHVSEIPRAIKQGAAKNFRRSSSSEIQDHIVAERKRRQVLTERFIALSAIIPGLKKTDKAYIVREAINYVKQLQERVKELESQSKRKKGDSVIFIKKSQASTTNKEETISCEDSGHGFKKSLLPKVEVRVLEKKILIGIHCEKQKDILLRLMALLQNLHLSVASSSVLPFGTSTIKVTIIAQMDDEYCMTVNDLVKNLRQDLWESYGIQKYIS